MRCWICTRETRGFLATDPRFPIGDPRRYPWDWVFCSRRCQQRFQARYRAWVRVQQGRLAAREAAVVDPTDVERAALRQCLKFFGEAAGEIGFEKPLGAYSEAEALQVIEAIVTAWTEAMAEHHAATRHPPMRGLPPVDDPFAGVDDGFGPSAGRTP